MANLNHFLSESFLESSLFGNTAQEYIVTTVVFILLLLAFGIFQKIVLRRLYKIAEHTKSDIDDEFIRIIKRIRPPFYAFLSLFLSVKILNVNDFLGSVINTALIIWLAYLIIDAVQILVDYIFRKKFSEEDGQSKTAAGVVGIVIKVGLWTTALLMVLANMGVNITSLVAGLGIGGIAVAMALKNILSDLFSSFAIYFDKPFLVGDFISAGDAKGTVEKIGIKTTRIRAPQGEEIVVSNNKLISGKIQNFKKLKERRISFTIGVTYNTSSEKLKMIPKIIQSIIEKENGLRFERVFFTKFGDSALNFEIVYTVLSADYTEYLMKNQNINFAIKDAFERGGIDMAYPTQTLYIEKNN